MAQPFTRASNRCSHRSCNQPATFHWPRKQACTKHFLAWLTARLPRKKARKVIRYFLQPDPVRDAYNEVFDALAAHEERIGGPMMVKLPRELFPA